MSTPPKPRAPAAPKATSTDVPELQALLGAGVEFVIVGGAAAVLHGAPITTQDLDIACSISRP